MVLKKDWHYESSSQVSGVEEHRLVGGKGDSMHFAGPQWVGAGIYGFSGPLCRLGTACRSRAITGLFFALRLCCATVL